MGKVIDFQKVRDVVEMNPNCLVSQTELAIMGMRLLEERTLYLLLKTFHDSYEILGLDSANGYKVYMDKGSKNIVNHLGGVFIYNTLKLPMTRKEDSMELYSDAYAYRIDCIRKEVDSNDSSARTKHGKQCISNKAEQV